MKRFAVLGILSGASAAALFALMRLIDRRQQNALIEELIADLPVNLDRDGTWSSRYRGTPTNDTGRHLLELGQSLDRAVS